MTKKKGAAKPKRKATPRAEKVAENCSAWKWTRPKELAAQLLADDELSDEQIAEQLNIAVRTLGYWKLAPEFCTRIEALAKQMGNTLRRRTVARRTRRLGALDDRWQRMRQVIAERSADPGMDAVPGGKTGLLVRTIKGLGSGENFQTVEEFEVDTGLLKELREHEKQAAQEVGDWAEKHDHSGTVKVVHKLDLTKLTDEQLDALESILRAGGHELGGSGMRAMPATP